MLIQEARHLDQDAIPFAMAMHVVDPLEIVQIQEQQRGAPLVMLQANEPRGSSSCIKARRFINPVSSSVLDNVKIRSWCSNRSMAIPKGEASAATRLLSSSRHSPPTRQIRAAPLIRR